MRHNRIVIFEPLLFAVINIACVRTPLFSQQTHCSFSAKKYYTISRHFIGPINK